MCDRVTVGSIFSSALAIKKHADQNEAGDDFNTDGQEIGADGDNDQIEHENTESDEDNEKYNLNETDATIRNLSSLRDTKLKSIVHVVSTGSRYPVALLQNPCLVKSMRDVRANKLQRSPNGLKRGKGTSWKS